MKKKISFTLFFYYIFLIVITTHFFSKNLSTICSGSPLKQSKATWYDLGQGLPHCSYPSNTLPQYFCAINGQDYDFSAVCGVCVEVSAVGCNKSPIVVQIVDECPYQGNEQWCYPDANHVDLNPEAVINEKNKIFLKTPLTQLYYCTILLLY
jgi:hypothetical protein